MEIGDYVRTKDGYIYKIEDGEEFYEDYVNVGIGTILDIDGIWVDKAHFQYVDKREIVKSSPNIIDLIEVGDILYLEESDDIACMFFKDIYLVKNEDNLLNIIGDIKNKKCNLISIVTKEQFESMEYKVGDK